MKNSGLNLHFSDSYTNNGPVKLPNLPTNIPKPFAVPLISEGNISAPYVQNTTSITLVALFTKI